MSHSVLYSPLSGSQIRLLSFHDKDSLRLEVHDLFEAPPYTALSYRWGEASSPTLDQECSKSALVNGHEVPVWPNLSLALEDLQHYLESARQPQSLYKHLRPLRWPSQFREVGTRDAKANLPHVQHFWIDALSIDQANTDERSSQVNLMQFIYGEAAFVTIWLERACESDLKCMDEMLSEEYVNVNGNPEYESFHTEWRGGEISREFRQSPYWKRLWTVQEVKLAANVCFIAGEASVTLYRAWGWIHHEMTSSHGTLWNRFINKQKEPLPELLKSFGGLECSDRRDRVFALLSLVDRSSTNDYEMLHPDYNLSWSQICKILRSMGIDIVHIMTAYWLK